MKGLVLKNSKWSKTTAPHPFRAKGFTLIELLVTIAMSSIVLAAIGSVYMGLTRSYTRQNVAADVQQTMRAGIDYVVEDIMMAGLTGEDCDEGIGYSPKFEAASIDAMRFTSDRNINCAIDNSNYENITYRYDNNALLLLQCLGLADVSLCDSASPDNILLENVTSLEFRYLDENGSGLGDPDPLLDPVPAADLEDIRTVVITMTVEEPAGRSGTVDRTYTTRVHCRNMGLE
jgi:type IV pilus assembly protein PilW